MASVSRSKNGITTIQFVLSGQRKSVWLGKVTKRDVAIWKHHIEELVAARKIGRAAYDETLHWLAGLDDELHRKLTGRAGLVEPRTAPAHESTASCDSTLAPFLDSYLAKQQDKKPSTIVCLTQCRNDLVAYFGVDKQLADVTEGDAEDWRQWLRQKRVAHPGRKKAPTARQSKASHRDRNKPKQEPKRLQENTIRRRCGRARQLFQAAVRHRLIDRNPFSELRGVSVLANKSRDYFVTREESEAVIKACPDNQWKLLFALSRYGGLRCPSEHLELRWSDIDWKHGRMLVRSPKTEHHQGKEHREIPLFPELRPHLKAVHQELPVGTPLSAPVITRYRDVNANLRTQLLRIMDGAGVKAWPKLFQNLRASRATELAQQHPGHVAAAWLGHSTAVAQRHYWQVTDEDFDRANQTPGHTPHQSNHLHNPMQSVAETRGKEKQRESKSPVRRDEHKNSRRSKCNPVAEAGVEPARGLPPNGF